MTSAPLPIIPSEPAARIKSDMTALMLVLCLSVASAVLSASFIVFPVRWVATDDDVPCAVMGSGGVLPWLPVKGVSAPGAGRAEWHRYQPSCAALEPLRGPTTPTVTPTRHDQGRGETA